MRDFVITLAGAVGGAALAIAAILTLAQQGKMPINDRQMQTYLMLHPELAMAMIGRYQAQEEAKQAQQQTAALKNKDAYFDPRLAFVTGPADAKHTVVEFYDYDCPFCRASLPAVKKFYDANKDTVRFSLIEFPIESLHGPSAMFAGRASLAARRQPEHYMDFHFAMLAEEGQVTEEMVERNARAAGMDLAKLKSDMADPAIATALKDSIALARKTGVDGTPTFILDGVISPGQATDEKLAEILKS
jgi:protein-disulfide isomerase